MPRDYSKYRNERPSSRGTYKRRAAAESSSNGGMVWLLMGVLIGLGIAGFAYLNQNKAHLTEMARNTLVRTAGSLSSGSDTSGSLANADSDKSKQTVKVAAAQNTANTPQFDFYNMLPSGQVSGPTGDDNSNTNTNNQSAFKSAVATTANATSNHSATAAANESTNNAGNNSADNSADDAEDAANNSANNAATSATNNVNNTVANSSSNNNQTNSQTNTSRNNGASNVATNNVVNNDAVNSNSAGETAAETAGSNSLASNEEKALTHGISPPAVATVALSANKKSKKLHVIAANTSASATSSESAPAGSDTSDDDTSTATGIAATSTHSATANADTSNAAAATAATDISSSPTTATPKSAEYVIQLGAFSHYEQADELKAQLAFSGFEAKIAPYKKGNITLQRVWMGPYNSLSAAAAVQRQLTDNQMKSTLLKTG